MIQVHPEPPGESPELTELLTASHREHLARYPELAGAYRAVVDPGARFLLARETGGEPVDTRRPLPPPAAVGCVAVQPLAAQGVPPDTYEIKRLYVHPRARGLGVGRALLGAAEQLSSQLGARVLYLETGVRHTAALRLFALCGFEPVPLYPPYLDDPFARCFGKRLAPPP